jgi:hypothetical protein
MTNWIELTNSDNGEKFLLNLNSFDTINFEDDKCYFKKIFFENMAVRPVTISAKESYNEVKRKISMANNNEVMVVGGQMLEKPSEDELEELLHIYGKSISNRVCGELGIENDALRYNRGFFLADKKGKVKRLTGSEISKFVKGDQMAQLIAYLMFKAKKPKV